MLQLALRLSEGLGISAFGWRAGCFCMREILLAAARYGKSSRGTPRLRRLPKMQQGAARLARPAKFVASRIFLVLNSAQTAAVLTQH